MGSSASGPAGWVIDPRRRGSTALVLALAAVLWVAPGAQAANGSFTPPASFPAGDGPFSVATGDFDADGDLDLVVANFGSATVSVLLGRAGGGFGEKTDVPAGRSPTSVAVGDFDGDADPDLAVTNGGYSGDPGFGTVSVLLGQAGGGFGPRTEFPTGDDLTSVAVGDFNGDSDPDLVVANHESSTVSVLLGRAGGDFAEKVDLPSGDLPTSVAVGDFNGDSDPDLAVTNSYSDTVSVLLGQDEGGFGTRTDYPTGDAPRAVAVGDFDGDSDPDLAVTNGGSDTVSVLLGQAGGGFGTTADFPTGRSPAGLAVGDFDGDTDPDLAVAGSGISAGDPGSHTVSVLLGQAGGGFGPRTDFSAGDSPYSVVVGDFNGDSDPDLAVTNLGPDTVSVLLGTVEPVSGSVFTVSPSSRDFGSQAVGTDTPAQAFTVTNTGTENLVITAVTLTGTDPAEFTQGSDTCTGQSVAPSGTCTVEVSFSPTNTGRRVADLRFTHSATTDPDVVRLVGTGTAPAIQCSGRAVTLAGTPGPDILRGTPGRDVVAGLGGDDRIVGLGGRDLVCAGPGDDRVRGRVGADRIRGGTGDDRLFGGRGNDLLTGGPGRDRLVGGPGRDRLTP